MYRKIRVLLVVATLASVGHLLPLDSHSESSQVVNNEHFFGRFAGEDVFDSPLTSLPNLDNDDDDVRANSVPSGTSSASAAPGVGIRKYIPVDLFTGILEKGAKIPKEALDIMGDHFNKVDEILSETDEYIAHIKSAVDRVQDIDLAKEYLDEYWEAKKQLRMARNDLQELALKTTSTVRDIKMLINDWDEMETAFIESELQMLKNLMVESLRLLKEAEKKYVNAINSMDKTSTQLSAVKDSLNATLSEMSSKQKTSQYTSRIGAYASAIGLTIGMAVLDATVCFGNILISIQIFLVCFCKMMMPYCISGACSASVTPAVWVTTIGAVETSLFMGEAQLAVLKEATVTVRGQIGELEELFEESVRFLEDELAIIKKWKVSADNVMENLELWSVAQLKKYAAFQKIFVMSLDDLGAAAQAFLDQGVRIFAEDDNPAHRDGDDDWETDQDWENLRYSTK